MGRKIIIAHDASVHPQHWRHRPVPLSATADFNHFQRATGGRCHAMRRIRRKEAEPASAGCAGGMGLWGRSAMALGAELERHADAACSRRCWDAIGGQPDDPPCFGSQSRSFDFVVRRFQPQTTEVPSGSRLRMADETHLQQIFAGGKASPATA